MRVLQLCKYYPPTMGGIELVEKTITKAHKELADDVHIVAFANESKSFKGEFSENIINIPEDLFLKSAPFNFKFIFHFKKIVEELMVDRIYVHLPNPYMHEVVHLAKSFLQKKGIQVVAVYHSDIVNQKFLGKLYTSYFKLTASTYNLWMCSSEKLWNSSHVLSSLKKEQQRIIPFCTDGIIQYRPRKKFRGKCLAVGRLVPYKGFDFLVEALKNTEYELHVVGNGPELDSLQKKASSNIIFHKNLSHERKSELFNDSDVLIVSSLNRSEAYGMTIVEAFEAGMPVVASDINSGVTFLTQHEKTGLVFEIKNKSQLLKCLERLKSEEGLFERLSLNARYFFEDVLTFDKFKEKIKNL